MPFLVDNAPGAACLGLSCLSKQSKKVQGPGAKPQWAWFLVPFPFLARASLTAATSLSIPSLELLKWEDVLALPARFT